MIDELFKPDCKYKRVFICGKITGDIGYRAKFRRAAAVLTDAGFHVMNPATLPSEGFTHEEYMTVTLAMLSVCDAVFFLYDWMDSPGAIEEIDKATRDGKPGFSFEMWLTEYQRRGNFVPSPVVLDGGIQG